MDGKSFTTTTSLTICIIYVVHPCGSLLGCEGQDQRIGSNFWKFYLITTLLVSLVKVFTLEQIVLVFRVWTQYVDVQRITYWQGERLCDALFYEKVWAEVV
jgi:hypothetical protein